MRRRRVAVAVLVLAGVAAPNAQAASTYAVINGSGSSWAAPAVYSWSQDERSTGLIANYDAVGSASARQQFGAGQTDFAASDLAYQSVGETPPIRRFSYVPLVAGAVAFPYHVTVRGIRKADIRLSGATLAGIFSGKITNWNDAAITADNDGHRVAPGLPIIPVVRADGAAVTYHVTTWFSTEFPEVWDSFSADGPTQFFPPSGASTVRLSGGTVVANYVASSSANGAIGYDENSYAANLNLPRAAIGNASGHFVAPLAQNVSVALRNAVPHRTQPADLSGVLTDPDPNAYPMSYYSYAIIPASAADPVATTTAKRQSLVDFFGYALCQGQAETTALGYAPLSRNLTAAGLRYLRHLAATDPAVSQSSLRLSSCPPAGGTNDR